MPPADFTALLLLTTAVSFTPGPNTTLSTALAANGGLRRALGFVLAVPVGWGLLLCLCAGGLGALVLAVPMLRSGISVLGVAYLLWLAYQLMGLRFDRRSLTWSSVPAQWRSTRAPLQMRFWQGVLLQFLNIKAWMLALSVVAGWVAGRPDALSRFALVLPLLLLFGLASNLSYALLGSLLRGWLAQGGRLLWFNRCMAGVLVLTAAWMATL
jgi:threonine/homoserine/homoserine lactone efflux protein